MVKYMSMPQSKSDVIVLQEKWTENIKKHPIAFGLLLLFCLAPLVLIFFVREEGSTSMIVLAACIFALFLLVHIPTIIRMISPKRYEVSLSDGKIKIIKEDKEILNVKGEQITFLDFVRHPLTKDVTAIKIQHTDEKSKTRYFTMSLVFISKEDIKELTNSVSTFYDLNVDKAKQTDGENWKKNFFIFLLITVGIGVYLLTTKEDASDKMIIAFIASIVMLIVSIVKLVGKKRS